MRSPGLTLLRLLSIPGDFAVDPLDVRAISCTVFLVEPLVTRDASGSTHFGIPR